MPDAQFSDPRLAAIYDDVDGERDDLDAYVAIAGEVGAHRVLDIGCGTGTLAIRLAGLGHDVTGVDPAAASVAIARSKPGAGAVNWVLGDTSSLPADTTGFDLAVMTGNVAQVFVDDADWHTTLGAIRSHLEPAGTFVFETRDPAARAWEHWDTGPDWRAHDTTSGPVGFRRDLLAVDDDAGLVTFAAVYRFPDDTEITSTSTLRFRGLPRIEDDLARAGLALCEVRDAPDRPGLEFVIIARPADPDR